MRGVLVSLGALAIYLGPKAEGTQWYLFGSVDRDESNATDIDLLILCKTDDQADTLRLAIDADALELPLHLALMTFDEAAETDAVGMQRAHAIFPSFVSGQGRPTVRMPNKRFERTLCTGHHAAAITFLSTWRPVQSGRDIVKGYRKWYGVDTVCAILELRQLGVDISETRLLQARRTEETTAQQRWKQKEQRQRAADLDPLWESDENFALIAGYASNDVPYGVLWEEWEGTDDSDQEDFS